MHVIKEETLLYTENKRKWTNFLVHGQFSVDILCSSVLCCQIFVLSIETHLMPL